MRSFLWVARAAGDDDVEAEGRVADDDASEDGSSSKSPQDRAMEAGSVTWPRSTRGDGRTRAGTSTSRAGVGVAGVWWLWWWWLLVVVIVVVVFVVPWVTGVSFVPGRDRMTRSWVESEASAMSSWLR